MLKVKTKKKNLNINIIPLIDIIFLMLVFFMLATNFQKNNEISFNVSNQKKIINEINEKKIFIISLKKNEITQNKKSLSLKDLENNYLEKWQQLNYERILILNDKKSSVQILITLLDLIKKYKINNVNFSDEPKKTTR